MLEKVERVVARHRAVLHCAAVAVAGARKVEAVRIYVVRRADMALGDGELTAWLKPQLARFELPRDVVFVDHVPRLGSGKLDRTTLAEWARQDLPA